MADDNLKHDEAKEDEDSKQRVVFCKHGSATGGHGATRRDRGGATNANASGSEMEEQARKAAPGGHVSLYSAGSAMAGCWQRGHKAA